MRFFGILAALTAVTSAFAAPVAVPAPNAELAAKRAEIAVPVKISKVVLALKVNTDGLIPQIQDALANPTGEVKAVVAIVKPLLGQVVASLKDTLKGLTTDPIGTVTGAVGDVTDTVEGTVESLTPQQLVDLLDDVVQTVGGVLKQVTAKLGNADSEITGLVQTIFSLLSLILNVVGGAVSAVLALVGTLQGIVGPILKGLPLSNLGLPLN
ncbi:hypothetical protein CPB86DRAFT_810413 [Serendipita vermifera]|nr:hypothetical protein CPB86DRAFT_810413 [Serendipita vermifera]